MKIIIEPISLSKVPQFKSTFLVQRRTVITEGKESSKILISFDFSEKAMRKISTKRLKELGQHMIDEARNIEEKYKVWSI